MVKAKAKKSTDTVANLGFEAKLWLTADKLRNNMDAVEYMFVLSEQYVEMPGKLIGDIGRSDRNMSLRSGHFAGRLEIDILQRYAS